MSPAHAAAAWHFHHQPVTGRNHLKTLGLQRGAAAQPYDTAGTLLPAMPPARRIGHPFEGGENPEGLAMAMRHFHDLAVATAELSGPA